MKNKNDFFIVLFLLAIMALILVLVTDNNKGKGADFHDTYIH